MPRQIKLISINGNYYEFKNKLIIFSTFRKFFIGYQIWDSFLDLLPISGLDSFLFQVQLTHQVLTLIVIHLGRHWVSDLLEIARIILV